ncbi:hypothetical protein BKA93DRAFT_742663, partial [Sparassis latifolia]
SMAPLTSLRMCQNMVVWQFEQKKTALEISLLAHCSERTVYNVLQLHCDFSQVTNLFASDKGRPRVLGTGDIEYISALIFANPALYLDELQEQLLLVRDVDVSLATIL